MSWMSSFFQIHSQNIHYEATPTIFSLSIPERFWYQLCQYYGNDFLATGYLILTLRTAIYIFRQLFSLVATKLISARLIQPKSKKSPPASIFAQVALTLELAIEFPIFVAFHPTALSYPTHTTTSVPFPAFPYALAQVAVFFFIESALQRCVLRFIAPCAAGKGEAGCHLEEALHLDDMAAFDLAMQFIRSRGALLLAIVVLGTPSALSPYTGKLHVLSMVGWAAML